eukprot:10460897-Karenia_brevis.AAC.1
MAPLFDERETDGGFCLDVISFNAETSACEKGGQWLRMAPLFVELMTPRQYTCSDNGQFLLDADDCDR